VVRLQTETNLYVNAEERLSAKTTQREIVSFTSAVPVRDTIVSNTNADIPLPWNAQRIDYSSVTICVVANLPIVNNLICLVSDLFFTIARYDTDLNHQ